MNELFSQMDVTIFHAGHITITLGNLVAALLVLTVGYWISRKARVVIQKVLAPRFKIDRSTAFALGTIAFYVIVIVTTMCALSILGFDISNLAIVAGALSVGIGLGLQNIANNFVSGLLLLFDSSIKVGDYVELGDGSRGFIEQIRVRSTIIRTNDDIEAIVPNSHFLSAPVINWTLSEASRRMHIPFGVAYGSDVDKVFDAIDEMALTLPDVKLDDPERMPRLWFTEMAESSLNFELIVWVKSPATMKPRGTTSIFLRAFHKTLLKNGFEIPCPQRDVHIRSMPDTALPSVSPS